MKVIVKNLQKEIKINPVKIRRIARKVNLPAKFVNLELRLYFVNNSVIKKLNKRFFSKDCLTDVISFYLNKDYAEVFLAPSAIKINAHNFRAEFKEELYRCVVHGMLHVFGSKDETNKDKIRMWKKQEALLKKIIPYG